MPRSGMNARPMILILVMLFAMWVPGTAHAQYPDTELSWGTEERTADPPPLGPPRGRTVGRLPQLQCAWLLAVVGPDRTGNRGARLHPEARATIVEATRAFQAERYPEAVELLLPTLASDYPETKFALGCLMEGLAWAYFSGVAGAGVPDDPRYAPIVTAIERSRVREGDRVVRAIDWMDRAARAGLEPAQWELAGRISQSGSVYPADESIRWYRQLETRGHVRATGQLGILYRDGIRAPADLPQAMRMFRSAGARGDRDAMWLLAQSYWRGLDGNGRDRANTLRWIRRLAEAGDARGQFNYAIILREGWGVPRSRALARLMLSRAAAQDHASAQFSLAQSLEAERGGRTADADRLFAAAARSRGDWYGVGHCMAFLISLERRLPEFSYVFDTEEARWDARRRLGQCLPYDAPPRASGAARAQGAWPDILNIAGVHFDVDTADFRRRSAAAQNALVPPDPNLRGVQVDESRGPSLPDVVAITRLLAADDAQMRMRAVGELAELRLGQAALDQILQLLDRRSDEASAPSQDQLMRYVEICDVRVLYAEWTSARWRSGTPEACGPGETLSQATIPQLRRLAANGSEDGKLLLGLRLLSDASPTARLEGLGLLRERAPVVGERRRYFDMEALRSAFLGVWLEEGRGVAPDLPAAYRAIKRSADSFRSEGFGRVFLPVSAIEWRLGGLLIDGRGVERDEVQGRHLIREAAFAGFIPAQSSLGDILVTEGDIESGVQWYRMAVRTDDPAAMVRFGFLAEIGAWNEQGLGMSRWYDRARSFADPMAELDLARAAAFAPERTGSLARVREHLRRGADAGNQWAAGWLSACQAARSTACFREQPDFARSFFRSAAQRWRRGAALQYQRDAAARALARSARSLRGRLAIAREEEGTEQIAAFLGDLETLHAIHGDTDAALSYRLERVLLAETARVGGQYRWLLHSACQWGQASRFAYRIGRTGAAIWFAKRSVNRLQEARAVIQDLPGDVRECFLRIHEDRYRWLADLFIEAGRFGEASAVLDMLKDFERQNYFGPGTERGQSDDRIALSPLEAENDALLQQARTAFGSPSEFQTFIGDLSRRMRALDRPEHQIRALSLRAHLADVQRRTEGTAILQSVVLPDQVRWILTTRNGGQEGISIALDRRRLAGLVRAYVEALQSRSGQVQTAGEAVYRALFEPVDRRLRALGVTQILVQGDGQLRYIPFAALWDGRQWLVERYAFSSFRSRDDYMADGAAGMTRVAGFGATRGRGLLPPLNAVVEELRSIVRTEEDPSHGIVPGIIQLDDAFSRDAFETALAQDYGVIHVASHFVLDPVSAERSFLLLGDGTPLSVSDFRDSDRLTFRFANLVIFSACRTALGDGVELDSLASAALDAGAATVLATLWSVSDRSTAALMGDFYRVRSLPGQTSAGALREAQLAMLRRGGATAHPYHWGPFVLMGRRE